jgi:hypothetical protein
MYLAVYGITKYPQDYDAACIDILHNAGTVTLYMYCTSSSRIHVVLFPTANITGAIDTEETLGVRGA